MKIETAIWICPKMCGCRLQISASWVSDSFYEEDGNTITYRHPIPNTISDITEVNTCAEHFSVLSLPLVENPYGGGHGYINPLPKNATPAEKLYIYLFRYSGGLHGFDTCDCKGGYWFNRLEEAPEPVYFKHPHQSRKCDDHFGISDIEVFDHVLKENRTKNQFLEKIIEKLPRVTKSKVDNDGAQIIELDPAIKYKWSFSGKDKNRELVVELQGATLSKQEKDSLKAESNKFDKSIKII